jgi:hypothetical protein
MKGKITPVKSQSYFNNCKEILLCRSSHFKPESLFCSSGDSKPITIYQEKDINVCKPICVKIILLNFLAKLYQGRILSLKNKGRWTNFKNKENKLLSFLSQINSILSERSHNFSFSRKPHSTVASQQ